MATLHRIQRAADAACAGMEDVRVDHRRARVAVAQELLDGVDVVARSSRCLAKEWRKV